MNSIPQALLALPRPANRTRALGVEPRLHALPVVCVAALQHRIGAPSQADDAGFEGVELEAAVGVDVIANPPGAAVRTQYFSG